MFLENKFVSLNEKKKKKYSLKISDKRYDNGKNVPIIDDKVGSILKEDEICILGYDKNWVYVFDAEQFLKVFSENFKMKSYRFKSSEKDIKETIILKDNYYVAFFEKLRKSLFSLIKEDEGMPEVCFLVHPISRKVSIKNIKEEEEIDILPLVKNDIKCLGVEDLLNRVDKFIQEEWDKLYKNRKIDYIS